MDALISLLTHLAPTLASILNGPNGAALLAFLGHLLNAAPEAATIVKALQPAPAQPLDAEAVAKVRALEAAMADQQSAAAAMQQSLQNTGEAYKLELQRGPYWSLLRPTAGWLMVASNFAFIILVLRGMWLGNYVPLDHMVAFLGAISPLAAVTGVYFWQRTTERLNGVESTPQPTASTPPKIVGKK